MADLSMSREKFLRLLVDLIKSQPQAVMVMPLGAQLRSVRRACDRHPEEGRALLGIPDEMARNITGDQERQDVIAVVRLPRRVVERALSPLILPPEIVR